MEHDFLWTEQPMHWNFQSLAESEDEFAHQHLMPSWLRLWF